MNDVIYLLWFVRSDPEEKDDGLLIGLYDSEDEAQEAIKRLRDKPGFSAYPEGFQVHSRKLNEDSWTSGFTTYE